MLNIGIIGIGRAGEIHVNALNAIPNAQLWSVCGRTLDSTEAFAKKYQANAKVYSDLHEMLDDPDLHAVIIATPDNLHAEQMILSAIAGKAILVEKPVCTSIESGEKLLATLAKYPVHLTVGYHLRWHSGFSFVAQKAKNNELGEIHRMQLRWGINCIDRAKWRLDPAYGKWCCLSAGGTHLIDLARWMLIPICGEVVSHTSKIQYLANTTIDEAASISLRFQSGAIADIFVSSVTDEPLSLEIYASGANVKGENLVGPIDERKIRINHEEFLFADANAYVRQLSAFVDSVLNNTVPAVSLEEGLKNVLQLIAIKN